MPKPLLVDVKPSVFKWLVSSSGWTDEEIANRLKTKHDFVKNVISGDKKPTFRQLKELSLIFKRPVAAFLLPEPKEEKPKPKDFRMLKDKTDKFDKKTLLVLRKARKLQDLCKELSGNMGQNFKPNLEKARIEESPFKFAAEYRRKLNLNEEKQRKFKTAYELFHYLRDVLEDMCVYSFQYSMPLEDARGFVFVDSHPYVIVVNTKDTIEARLFSLMHEFGHVILRQSAIDLPDESHAARTRIEKWCNRFSAEFLLPKKDAKRSFQNSKHILTQGKTLDKFSRKFKVSKITLLISMKELGFIKDNEFKKVLDRLKRPLETQEQKKTTSRKSPKPEKKILSEIGNKFVSLVANNYDKEFITYTDALEYLSTKSKNFDKVLAEAKK